MSIHCIIEAVWFVNTLYYGQLDNENAKMRKEATRFIIRPNDPFFVTARV